MEIEAKKIMHFKYASFYIYILEFLIYIFYFRNGKFLLIYLFKFLVKKKSSFNFNYNNMKIIRIDGDDNINDIIIFIDTEN